ncbi:MAG: hypothetical protein KDD33_03120 [Bdellovibrionales bacterium]|nr:hypothetical protein [Bdellovibrionales bacterium]
MHLAIVFLILTLSGHGLAHADTSGELRILKEIKLAKGKAFLVVRKDEHLLGRPFQVEVRAQCPGDASQVEDLAIKDSYSVCDLEPDSVKLNKKRSALALKTKEANVAAYEDQIAKGNMSAGVDCMRTTKILKFSLTDLCK